MAANQPFDNRGDPDPFNPNATHSATGLLVVGGGDMLVWKAGPDGRTWTQTTDASAMIEEVESIHLAPVDGRADRYRLTIVGGAWKNVTKLAFTDAGGATHTLRLIAHARGVHVLDFDSPTPDIVKLTWDY